MTWKLVGGFRILPLLCQLQKSCITLNNDKLNGLQRCDTAQNLGFCAERLIVWPDIITKCRTAIFRSFVKLNNDSYKACRYVHDILLYQFHLSYSYVKRNTNFKFQTPARFVFLVFHKNCLMRKAIHPLNTYQHRQFNGASWMVEVFHPSQKFESPQFWNVWRYGIQNYGIEASVSGMSSLPNFIKVY
jgi:hypothetical protein